MIRHMARKQVLVQLDADLVAALDVQAEREGVSRSELLRRGARRILEDSEITELERQHEEGYRRFPQTEDEAFPVSSQEWPEW